MPPAGRDDRTVTAVLGPTNTGKTRLAIERLCAHATGVIGLPLRLLAREVYDRVVEEKGRASVALLTGEEKIAPPNARYFVCTVEAMPSDIAAEFVAVDEIQLASDPDRGHVFTQRIMHSRGQAETMLLGAETMRPLVRALAPDARHDRRERFSTLTHAGAMKLTKLPRRTAVVAFSAEEVYAIAELMRRQRGGSAVVMGALSPRTRNAQVALYQSGEVDFLIATDAIGMGLNMDVDHVAFASLRKFDGRRRRPLRAEEIAQIAGRAGRYTRDGTFGTTGDCRPLPDDVVERVESHTFDAVKEAQWRAHDLDFSSLDLLRRSLDRAAPERGLLRVREVADEAALDALARDDDIAPLCGGPRLVARLWSACQLPDFRKLTIDQHVRLVAQFARHLLGPRERLPVEWVGAEIEKLNKPEGDVDALAARLAHVRTWTYAANRSDWLDDPAHWRGVAQEVEDRLSDALHDRLTQRFVDRRTSALMRGLRVQSDLETEVNAHGEVSVEGHFVGRIEALTFHPDQRGGSLDARTLRNVAVKALRPEINHRLTKLAHAEDGELTLSDQGEVQWDGHSVGALAAGASPLKPETRMRGGELGADAPQKAARARLERFVAERIAEDLKDLVELESLHKTAPLTGPARGLAYRLFEALGSMARRELADVIADITQDDRRHLRKGGVRLGEHVVFLPNLVRPKPARLLSLLVALAGGSADAAFLPPPGRTSVPADGNVSAKAYAAAGFKRFGPLAVRLDMLERLADLIRETRTAVGHREPFPATEAMVAALGCSKEQLSGVLKALGYRRVKTAGTDEAGQATPELWRPEHAPRRREPRRDDQRQGAKPARERAPRSAPAPVAGLAGDVEEGTWLDFGQAASAPSRPPARKRPRKRSKPRRDAPKPAVADAAGAATEAPGETPAAPPSSREPNASGVDAVAPPADAIPTAETAGPVADASLAAPDNDAAVVAQSAPDAETKADAGSQGEGEVKPSKPKPPRKRGEPKGKRPPAAKPNPDSPFAVLAELTNGRRS